MAITPLPAAPAVTDTTAEFNQKAFAFVDALDDFVTEANALAAEVNQDAIDVAAAAIDAAEIETIWGEMNAVFLGGKTSDPALDNEGNPLVAGATYFNTVSGILRAYDGANWVDTGTAIPIMLTLDEFNGTGAQTAFTLSVTPANANSVRVAISGVLKRPTTDYTVSGTTLTFAVAPANGTGNVSCLTTTPVAVGVPGDDTVSTAKLQDNAVTLAKLQNIATARILGRATAGSGAVEELTGAQVAALTAAATTSAAGVVELATTAETLAGTDPGRAVTPEGLTQGGPLLGMQQTYNDVKASRAFTTEYTNSTSRPILVKIVCSMIGTPGGTWAKLFTGVSSANIEVDYGYAYISSGAITVTSSLSCVVPPGHKYKLTRYDANTTIIHWTELR